MSVKSFTVFRDFSAEVTLSQKKISVVRELTYFNLVSKDRYSLDISTLANFVGQHFRRQYKQTRGKRTALPDPLGQFKPICCKSIVDHCTLDVGVKYCYHFLRLVPKLKVSNTFIINGHSKELNALLKSSEIRIPPFFINSSVFHYVINKSNILANVSSFYKTSLVSMY